MKSVHTRRLWLCLVMAIWGSTLGSRSESVPAIGRDPAFLSLEGSSPGAGGWTFYVRETVRVSGVGWYDEGGDGLLDIQPVNIWKDLSGLNIWPFFDPYNASLVTSVAIPAGTLAPLDGSWRRLDFETALTLEPGGYEISGTNWLAQDLAKFLFGNQGPNLMHPSIGLGAPADGLVPPPDDWPGFVLTYGAYLGPMFFVEDPKLTIISDSAGKLTISPSSSAIYSLCLNKKLEMPVDVG